MYEIDHESNHSDSQPTHSGRLPKLVQLDGNHVLCDVRGWCSDPLTHMQPCCLLVILCRQLDSDPVVPVE